MVNILTKKKGKRKDLYMDKKISYKNDDNYVLDNVLSRKKKMGLKIQNSDE